MTIENKTQELGPVQGDGTQDGQVASVSPAAGEIWYVQQAYFSLDATANTNITDSDYQLQMMILDANASTGAQSGVRRFDSGAVSLGGDGSTAVGLTVDFAGTRGGKSSVDAYITEKDKVALHEASDSNPPSTPASWVLRLEARRLV